MEWKRLETYLGGGLLEGKKIPGLMVDTLRSEYKKVQAAMFPNEILPISFDNNTGMEYCDTVYCDKIPISEMCPSDRKLLLSEL